MEIAQLILTGLILIIAGITLYHTLKFRKEEKENQYKMKFIGGYRYRTTKSICFEMTVTNTGKNTIYLDSVTIKNTEGRHELILLEETLKPGKRKTIEYPEIIPIEKVGAISAVIADEVGRFWVCDVKKKETELERLKEMYNFYFLDKI